MNIKINSKGNGACPMCRFVHKCNIHKTINDAFNNFSGNDSMEVVIYECPKFKFNEH